MALTRDITLRACHGPQEFPALVAIWRSAVDATHDFVSRADLDRIEHAMAAEYLPSVTLTVAELDGRAVGFAGVTDNWLHMLFVDDTVRGRGIGSALLDHVTRDRVVTDLEVNEQNPLAVTFYTRKGFDVIGRRERDDAGYPYPLLHMRLADRLPSEANG